MKKYICLMAVIILMSIFNYSFGATCTLQSATLCINGDDNTSVWVNGNFVGDFNYVGWDSTSYPGCVSVPLAYLNATGNNVIAMSVTDTAGGQIWGAYSLDVVCVGGLHSYVSSNDGGTKLSATNIWNTPPGNDGGGNVWNSLNYDDAAWPDAIAVTNTTWSKPLYSPKDGKMVLPYSYDNYGSAGANQWDPSGMKMLYMRKTFTLNPVTPPPSPTITINKSASQVSQLTGVITFSITICNSGGGYTTQPLMISDYWVSGIGCAWSYSGPWYQSDLNNGILAQSGNSLTVYFPLGMEANTCKSFEYYLSPCWFSTDYSGPAWCSSATNFSSVTWTSGIASDLVDFAIFCPSSTDTPTHTQTINPSPSYTRTATQTFSVTFTRTQSPSPTVSASYSPTATWTMTRTVSATPTSSATLSMTLTYTNTQTCTPSLTASYSATNTNTATNSITYTPTFTKTPSPTFTATPSVTITTMDTSTATKTNTQTFTPSPTSTITLSSTPSYSKTATPTITITTLDTATVTKTITATFTSTNTFTMTFTNTVTATASATPTSTNTIPNPPTSTATQTNTPTKTQTSTFTEVNTSTNTQTATMTSTDMPTGTATFTITNSATRTVTLTGTNTNTQTMMPTLTNTVTNTLISTATQSSTYTFTCTITPTITFTQTPAGTPALLTIEITNRGDNPGPGAIITYRIRIINNDTVPAKNLRVWDSLPVELEYMETQSTETVTVSGKYISWEMPANYVLNPGEETMIVFTVKIINIEPGSLVINEASLDYNDGLYIGTTRHPAIKSSQSFYPEGEILVFPNPFDSSKSINGKLKFANMVPGAIIQVYSLSGETVFVADIGHDVKYSWNLKNRHGKQVSPGIYYWVVKNPVNSRTSTGKLFIVK